MSRDTIRKWLRGPLDGLPKYQRGVQPRKLAPIYDTLKRALEVDGHTVIVSALLQPMSERMGGDA